MTHKKSTMMVTGNKISGVHWDAEAVEAVTLVAKALLNLTELFRAQNIHIESLVTFEAPLPGTPEEPEESAEELPG